jgi:predicted PurR-regulated permease PerM
MTASATPAAPRPPRFASEASSGPPWWGWLIVVAASAGVAYTARILLLPLLIGLLGAYVLNPLVVRLQARGLGRGPAVVLLCIALGLGVILALYLLIPTLQIEGRRFVAEAPAFAIRIESALDVAAKGVRERWPLLARLVPARAPGWLLPSVETWTGERSELAGRAGEVLLILVLAPGFGFFLLRDGPGAVRWILGRMHPRHIETSVAVWAEIDHIIGQYLRGLVIESLVVGVLVSVGLWFLGVPLPLLIGLFAAMVNPLPYIGVFMSFGVTVLVALTSQMGFATLGSAAALFVAIRLVDDLLLVPITIGRAVHLHPMLVVASIVIGEQVLGVPGMVVAVPTVTVLKEATRLLLEHRRALAGRPARWPAQRESAHIPL